MRQKLARGALIAVLAASAVAYGALEKRVTVRIEGTPVHLRTFATSVGDALGRAGIPVGPRDRVRPALGARLADGAVIEVLRAKPITILLNGQPRRVIVTGLTVEEVIREMSLRGAFADFVGPSRAARVTAGMLLTYREAVGLTVVHDGRTERVITNAGTVGEMLAELGVTLGSRDRLLPGASVYPSSGMAVRVLRVGIREESETRPIPFTTIVRRDPSVETGDRVVVQRGRAGARLLRFRSTYVDGRRVARTLLASTVVREPRPKVLVVGSGPRCICTRGTQTGKATWYDAPGLTAAHPWLPFGTVVRVVNLDNGRSVNVVIKDRGPFGAGRIIDLSDEAFGRLARLSEGVISVRIRW